MCVAGDCGWRKGFKYKIYHCFITKYWLEGIVENQSTIEICFITFYIVIKTFSELIVSEILIRYTVNT